MKHYNDLNSKERFFRTLWFLPVGLAVTAGVLWFVDGTSRLMAMFIGNLYMKLGILAIIAVLGMVQLASNYSAWKNEGL